MLELLEAQLGPLLVVGALRNGPALVVVAVKLGGWQIEIVVAKVLLTPLVIHNIQQGSRAVKVRHEPTVVRHGNSTT